MTRPATSWRETNLANGLMQEYTYDALNRPLELKQTIPLGGPGLATAVYSSTYRYEDADNAVVMTNPRGVKQRVDKDGLDRVYQKIDALGVLDLATTYTYDGNGNPHTVSDPQGGDVDVTYQYDGLNRLIVATYVSTPGDAGPVEERTFYDGNDNVVRRTDRRGIAYATTFDNLDRELTSVVMETITNGGLPLVLARSVYTDALDANGLGAVARYDANGNSIVTRYDTFGRIARIEDAAGVTTYAYDGVNQRASVDHNGNRTEQDFDANNRLVTTREFSGTAELRSTLRTEYDDAAMRKIDVDRRGVTTTLQLDALGRVRQLKKSGLDMASRYGAAEILLEAYDYDADNNEVALVDAQGNTTVQAFDAANRKVAMTAGAGTPDAATTTWTYDRVGNMLTEKDARTHGGAFDVQYAYDARYRRISETNGEGQTTLYAYDASDNLVQETEPGGPAYTTRYRYGELGELLAVDETPRASTTTVAGITRFVYDANRNKIAQQDANGNLVTYHYDQLDRLTDTYQHTVAGSITDATRRGADPRGTAVYAAGNEATALHWRYAYDANGNQNLLVDARGQRVVSAFDYLNRLTVKTYGDAAEPGLNFQPRSIAYAYDPNANPLAITETKSVSGSTYVEVTTLAYDALERVRQRTRVDYDNPAGKTVSYTYDRRGNRLGVVDPDGKVTTYTYDALNRLSTVVNEAGTTTYQWWPDGLLKLVVFPNQTVTDRSAPDAYDRADRLRKIANSHVGPAIAYSSYTYTYDANGNRLQQVETQKDLDGGQPVTTTYGYDNLNRLAQVTYAARGALRYTYDAAGNRLSEQGVDPQDGQPIDRTYSYGALPSRPGVTYDHVNALSRVADNLDPAQDIIFEYDANLNETAREQGGVRTVYRYDIRDQLVAALVNGGLTEYDYNADGLRVRKVNRAAGAETRYLYDDDAVLLEYAGAGFATQRKYDYGEDLLSLTEVAGATRSAQFFLLDGLGSTANLSDPAGNLVQTYRYDAWGALLDEVGSALNPRQYTGHYRDEETGLQYFGARYYDEETGRFLSPDPYLGEANTPPSLHRYLYAYANPVRFVDLTGYAAEEANGEAGGGGDIPYVPGGYSYTTIEGPTPQEEEPDVLIIGEDPRVAGILRNLKTPAQYLNYAISYLSEKGGEYAADLTAAAMDKIGVTGDLKHVLVGLAGSAAATAIQFVGGIVAAIPNLFDATTAAYEREGGGLRGVYAAAMELNPIYRAMVAGSEAKDAFDRGDYVAAWGKGSEAFMEVITVGRFGAGIARAVSPKLGGLPKVMRTEIPAWGRRSVAPAAILPERATASPAVRWC